MHDWKLVLEAFPMRGERHFWTYSCASAAFYTRASSAALAVATAEQELALQGWCCASVLRVDPIRLMTESEIDILELLERGSHVCNLRRVSRLFVRDGTIEVPGPQLLELLYERFILRVGEDSFVLRPDGRRGCSTLVLEQQEIFPVWVSSKESVYWRHRWSLDREVERMRADELILLISDRVSDDALLALGLSPTILVTFHPRALTSLLEKTVGDQDRGATPDGDLDAWRSRS